MTMIADSTCSAALLTGKVQAIRSSLYSNRCSDSEDESSGSEGSDEGSGSEDCSGSSYESDTSCNTLLDALDQELFSNWPTTAPKKENSALTIKGTPKDIDASNTNSRKSPQLVSALLTAMGSEVQASPSLDSDASASDASDEEDDLLVAPTVPVSKAVTVDFRAMLFKRMSQKNVTSYVQDKGYASGASSVASADPSPPTNATAAPATVDPNHPEEQLQRILSESYSNISDAVASAETKRLELPLDYWTDYFVPVTQARTNAYIAEKAQALRSQNLTALQGILSQDEDQGNNSLDACNAQGESLLHIGARRHNLVLLQFLHKTAGVDLRVRDDCCKNALHELCWTRHPSSSTSKSDNDNDDDNDDATNNAYWNAILYVIRHCPELLLARDERGFQPLHYVPQESFSIWNKFLSKHHHFLQGQGELLRFQLAKHTLQATLDKIDI